MCGCLSHVPYWGPGHHSQACALTGNQTGNPLVLRPVVNPLSYTVQGPIFLTTFYEEYHEFISQFTGGWLLLLQCLELFLRAVLSLCRQWGTKLNDLQIGKSYFLELITQDFPPFSFLNVRPPAFKQMTSWLQNPWELQILVLLYRTRHLLFS